MCLGLLLGSNVSHAGVDTEWDWVGKKRELKVWINVPADANLGGVKVSDAVSAAKREINSAGSNWKLEEGSREEHDIEIRLADVNENTGGGMNETVLNRQREASKWTMTIDPEPKEGKKWGSTGDTYDPITVIIHELLHKLRIVHQGSTTGQSRNMADPSLPGDHQRTLSDEDKNDLRESDDVPTQKDSQNAGPSSPGQKNFQLRSTSVIFPAQMFQTDVEIGFSLTSDFETVIEPFNIPHFDDYRIIRGVLLDITGATVDEASGLVSFVLEYMDEGFDLDDPQYLPVEEKTLTVFIYDIAKGFWEEAAALNVLHDELGNFFAFDLDVDDLLSDNNFGFDAKEPSTAFTFVAIGGLEGPYPPAGAVDYDWIISGDNMYSGVLGNVGIGTTSPIEKLHVDGNIKVTGFGNGLIFPDESRQTTAQLIGPAGPQGPKGDRGDRGAAGPTLGVYDSLGLTSSGGRAAGDAGARTLYNLGNVGIGTTNPQQALSVNGAINLDQANINSGSLNPGITFGLSSGEGIASKRTAAGNQYGLDFYTNFANRMSITQVGNVGIGTTSPAQKLDVRGQIQVQDSIRLDAADEPMMVRQWDVCASGAKNGFGRWGMYMEPQTLFLGVPGTDYAFTSSIRFGGWLANSTRQDWLTIQEGGNVGIGTMTPGAKLEVAGQVKITGGSPGAGKVLTSDAVGLATWQVPPAGIQGRGTVNRVVKFVSAAVMADGVLVGDSAIFESGGKVGIGTATPSQLLEVQGSNPRILINATASNPEVNLRGPGRTEWAMYQDILGGTGDLRFYQAGDKMTFQNGTGNVGIGTTSPGSFKLAVNGSAAKPGGGSWSSFSDMRLKNLHGSYERGLSEISRLNPVRYRYREDNELRLAADKECVGLVAQDVQKVVPEAVQENSNGYLMVNNDPIIWAMVNSIKELRDENQELKQRLEALEKIVQQQDSTTKQAQE